MLGYASEERLKALLIGVGDGERDLEAARQRLCSIRDFALHSAFERVDRDATNWVSSKEIVDFLRDNGVFHVSDAEAFDLVKFFDSDGNSKLSFQEFIQMLLPCEDNVLRNITIDRPSIRVGRFERLPRDIEEGIVTILVKEVELERRLEMLKRDLYVGLDYSVMAAFRSIDRANTGSITTVNLGGFMRDHGHFASETELLAIVRRLDTDGDACISYSEWLEFLRNPPAEPLPLPIPAPVRLPEPLPLERSLPSYYYSRYYDWPLHRYGYDWRDSSYLDRYDLPYSRYYPSYYSRYYSPYWYSRYAAPSESKSVSYDVEKPTPYSPARTVKRETYHSPYGSRTYKSYL